MPDFDIDFEDTQRERVIEYVKQKYGNEQVSGIATYMQMASKAAFKDVARVLGVPFEKSNQVSALMPDRMSVMAAIEAEDGSEELKTLYNTDEKIKQAAKLSAKLEGNMRQIGVHACGIIIAPDEVSKFSPTQYSKEGDTTIIAQYDGPALETI
jgi:DNA polymerase-3 subunit alpha